eukprot:TRINITY_DN65250_c0_g1_i1.p1 TRINITY_DN65250_c0_g1~~TRINITY_DN65250_c0_g1_i1.p1  ORF type:complete len:212 (+),score=145.52 TRINITY_DN65250_c0_g1_i1:53-637(+)
MQGSIEQLYPRSRLDYEEYADKIFRVMSAQTLEKDKKQGGNNAVVMLNAMLSACLSETNPEEVKGLLKLVDDQCNKKIEAHNKDIGKVKSKLKGLKMYEDGDGDFSHLEKEKEEDVEELQKREEDLKEKQRRDEDAQKKLAEKEKEREALQAAMKKEERKVNNTFAAQGFKMMSKKDDDDMMGGFGGKKKGKKK